MSYANKRYFTYTFITLFILIVPFITIDGNHLLLLSFKTFEFHFLGISFSASEFYIMMFLLIFLFIGVIAMTSMLGRIWCGWACPQTIFRVIYRDLIEGTLLDIRKIKNKQKGINYSKKSNILKKALSFLIWGIICIVISTNFVLYFVAYEDFFVYMQEPSEHIFMILFILGLASFIFFDIVYLREKFCIYICPYSSTQTVLYDDDTKHVIYDKDRGGEIYHKDAKSIFNVKQWSQNEECTTCEACVKVCPTGIDIRKGLQLECINCLECSDACSTVMGKLGKKSLINWESNYSMFHKIKKSIFSKRNIIFFSLLMASVLFSVYFATEKQHVLVNSYKAGPPYRVDKNGLVFSSYLIAVHNTQNKAYTYDIKLEDTKNFRIKRFKSFTLKANKRRKKILVIESINKLSESDKHDTMLKVKITVFAKEDATIQATDELAFIYPKDLKAK